MRMTDDVSKVVEKNRKKRARLLLMDLQEVPPKSWYDTYIQRTLPGGSRDLAFFEKAAQMQRWTLLYGPTGAGKTLVGIAVAAKLGRRYASINFHGGISSDHLLGRWVPSIGSGMPTIDELRKKYDGDSQLVNAHIHKYRINYEWIDGRLTDLFRNGGVLDLAEINMAPPAVTSFLFQMLDDRCQLVLDDKDNEVVHAHPNFWCLANYNEGYAGTEEMNDALLSRFPIKLHWGYDDDVENHIVTHDVVKKIAKRLRDSGEVKKDVGTRDLRDFCDNIDLFGEDLAGEIFASSFDPVERKPVKEMIKMEYSAIAEERRQKAEEEALSKDSDWRDGLGAGLGSDIPVYSSDTP